MADVLVTLRIMPESPEVDLRQLEKEISEHVLDFDATLARVETEPVAFGLNALNVTVSYNEKRGTSDELEATLASIKGVQSVDVVDVRRVFG